MSSHRDRSRSPIQIRAPCERRVYVANIPFDMKWTELKDLFKRECGENSVSFVRYFEDTDGKFRGCGIVEFKDSEATKRAIEKLHRYELNGRFLVVKEDYDVERDSTGRVVTRRQRDRDGGHRDRSPPRRERSPPSRDYGGHGGHGGHGGSGGPGTGGVSFNTYGLSPKFLDSLGIELPLSNKLFIANLDYKVTKSDLKRLFKLCGRVLEVELYVDKDGNSKGNATVELDHPIEAVQAISMLNRQVFNTYGLSPKFLDSLGIDLPLTNKLFVSNLDYKVTKADLKRLFKICGRVLEVNLYMDKDGNSKGNATVELDHPIEAVQAISMLNRQVYQGRSLAIRMDRKENEELKLPAGLEGLGKGLGPGGVALRLPRDFAPVGSAPLPPPTPTPSQTPAPPPVLPVAALAALGALAYPQDPVTLAALANALDPRAASHQAGGGNLFSSSSSIVTGGIIGGGVSGGLSAGSGMNRSSGSLRNGSIGGSSRYNNDSGLGGSQKGKYADKDTKWGY
ncbi:heterogeneous nuclear ribonucleoprotein M-like isoform X3 [Varroa jacobsoni]|uniref:RRM domain-containing protein n=1 Tax=Varroa destructor TaxID=109461 RepID=A0A7M7J1K5_VARDE|nr:heterogeneous nuclear ribonucleoprotein M-like isoform X3 [Varroa destructor]XP_022687485.1 heterogeneous nuclear ribonucleoprotein M-like isoform X3 [Varroa jacobsoni]